MISRDDLTVRTVPGLLDALARIAPQRPALIAASSGVPTEPVTTNYGELHERAQRVAQGLAALGLGSGQRLGILLDNTYATEAQVAYHAAHRIGMINVPLNTRLVPAELSRAVDQAGVDAIVYGARVGGLVDETLGQVKRDVRLICIGAGGNPTSTPWPALAQAKPLLDSPVPGANDDADWIFTSGTTSTPKLAMFTHAAAVACGQGAARAFSLGPDDVYQSSAPFFTSTGVHTNPLGVLAGGGTYLVDPSTDLESFLRLAATYQTTVCLHVTTLLRLLVDRHRSELARLPDLRRIQYGGMPISAEEHAQLYAVLTDELGLELAHTMGLTEGGPTGLFLGPEEGPQKPGSIGRTPFSDQTEFRIVGDDAGDVARGDTGELCYRGPSVMRGYRGADAGAGFLDGWLRTGDLVRQDDDGYVFFVSRKKDIIRRGGLNIAAAEVENVLRQAPGVRDAAVVPTPHVVLGEDLLAILEADEGLDIEAVQNHCRRRLAAYKVPREIRVVAAFPRNGMGRVVKAQLTRLVALQLSDGRERAEADLVATAQPHSHPSS